MSDKFKVNEIFYSLDGEGERAGYPSVFIRLSGCNLRCNYCDTIYAFDEGRYMSTLEIEEMVNKFNCKNITLTGGEPLLQKNVLNLIASLYSKGYEIVIETNGSVDIRDAQHYAVICMDWKTRSSGVSDKMLMDNLSYLKDSDILKIVVRDEDLADVEKLLDEYPIKASVYLSPVFGEIELPKLAHFVMDYKGTKRVKMQLQMHKYIWNPDERGV